MARPIETTAAGTPSCAEAIEPIADRQPPHERRDDVNGDCHGREHRPPTREPSGMLSSASESICAPRCTKNNGMAKPSPMPTQLQGDAAWLAEECNHAADREPGDEDRGAESVGQPGAR